MHYGQTVAWSSCHCSSELSNKTRLFTDTISQFTTARNARNPPSLDWSSDNCSDSPDNPLGFNFVPSCQRHDFGYRNYKKQSRFTAAAKAKIDSNFKKDLDNQCTKYNAVEEAACKGIAEVYYEAVKEFGHKMRRETEA